MPDNPAVSIIVSAYNRPQVVSFAIRSVLESDFADWELIVVGDGCNAETQAAIRAFADPRIRFHNLPENSGHQSVPHNTGVAMARGEFVFFLNQDDMYFPDHLSRRVAFMRETGADVSWSPIVLMQHCGLDAGPVDVARDRLTLDGATADGYFDPESFVISSCWAIRREICGEVGPWLEPHETRLSPSQEWLHRAAAQGRRMAYHPLVSVFCIHSGARRYSYLFPDCVEHERAFSWLGAGPQARLDLMHAVAVHEAAELVVTRKHMVRPESGWRKAAERLGQRFGVHPHVTRRFLAGVRKGGWVGNHMPFTASLPPELAPGAKLQFGEPEADIHLGRGWLGREIGGRWSGAATGEVFFSLPQDAGPFRLEVCGHALRPVDAVTYRINDEPPVTRQVSHADDVQRIDLPAARACRLRLTVAEPVSPFRLGISQDRRMLGVWLKWARLVRA